jgi:hypothetical protein
MPEDAPLPLPVPEDSQTTPKPENGLLIVELPETACPSPGFIEFVRHILSAIAGNPNPSDVSKNVLPPKPIDR